MGSATPERKRNNATIKENGQNQTKRAAQIHRGAHMTLRLRLMIASPIHTKIPSAYVGVTLEEPVQRSRIAHVFVFLKTDAFYKTIDKADSEQLKQSRQSMAYRPPSAYIEFRREQERPEFFIRQRTLFFFFIIIRLFFL
jgi:hypothetical protein